MSVDYSSFTVIGVTISEKEVVEKFGRDNETFQDIKELMIGDEEPRRGLRLFRHSMNAWSGKHKGFVAGVKVGSDKTAEELLSIFLQVEAAAGDIPRLMSWVEVW